MKLNLLAGWWLALFVATAIYLAQHSNESSWSFCLWIGCMVLDAMYFIEQVRAIFREDSASKNVMTINVHGDGAS